MQILNNWVNSNLNMCILNVWINSPNLTIFPDNLTCINFYEHVSKSGKMKLPDASMGKNKAEASIVGLPRVTLT